jgi:hypothetical protein
MERQAPNTSIVAHWLCPQNVASSIQEQEAAVSLPEIKKKFSKVRALA